MAYEITTEQTISNGPVSLSYRPQYASIAYYLRIGQKGYFYPLAMNWQARESASHAELRRAELAGKLLAQL